MMPYRCDITRMVEGTVRNRRNEYDRTPTTLYFDMPCGCSHMDEKLREEVSLEVEVGSYLLRFPLNYRIVNQDTTSAIRHLDGTEKYPPLEVLRVLEGRNFRRAICRRVGEVRINEDG